MKVYLLRHTPEPERVIFLAARLCYSSKDIQRLEEDLKNKEESPFLRDVLSQGHLSVLEHASFSFGIEGISRVTSHQLVRHRIASYSQQSQRYVSFKGGMNYVIPPSIKERADLCHIFSEVLEKASAAYLKLLEAGISTEDARFILPSAVETRLILTMNARELLHFFELRCCRRAQWEIRAMAMEMLRIVRKIASNIFKDGGPSCIKGKCREGKMACGQKDEVIKEFSLL